MIGGTAFQVTRILGANNWVISLALGFVALPLGTLIHLIPNVKLWLLPKLEEEPTSPPTSSLALFLLWIACATI